MNFDEHIEKYSIKKGECPTISATIERFETFVRESFASVLEEYDYLIPVWLPPITESEFDKLTSFHPDWTIPADLRELYLVSGVPVAMETLDLYSAPTVFNPDSINSMSRMGRFEPEALPSELYGAIVKRFAVLGVVNLAARQVYIVFDREGQGFTDIVIDDDDYFEDELIALADPTKESPRYPLNAVLGETVNRLIAHITNFDGEDMDFAQMQL